jgi:hypothetical protein
VPGSWGAGGGGPGFLRSPGPAAPHETNSPDLGLTLVYRAGDTKAGETFRRAGRGATYVDSGGLVKDLPVNEVDWSEDFSNAAWLTTGGSAKLAHGLTDPDGGTTASSISLTGTSAEFYNDTPVRIGDNTVSVYIRWVSGATSVRLGTFDGTTHLKSSDITITSSWTRISAVITAGATNASGNFSIWANTAGTATTVEIAFFQAQYGATLTRYIPTSGAAGGDKRDAHYIDGDGPYLLLEEQRENILHWSRLLTDAGGWSRSFITPTQDQTGVDGVANSAARLTATNANGTLLQTVTLASSQRVVAADVKRITGSGTVSMTTDGGTTWTPITVTGSWTRVSIPPQTVTNPVTGFRLGTNGDEIAVDYADNQNGAFPTSRIYVTDPAVTRGADSYTILIPDGMQGVASTLYERYIDLADGATVERVIPVTPGTTYTFPINRAYDRTAIAGGVRDLATMQALFAPATLIADPGTFTTTGVAAGLIASRTLPVTVGTFTDTGNAAGLIASRKLPATVGTFTETGIAATLRAARTLIASVGTFTETGPATGLLFTRHITAAAGSFTLTGIAAVLRVARKLPATVGTFTETGVAAVLRVARKLAVTVGTFTLTGIAAVLKLARKLVAPTGTYTLTGQSASTKASRVLLAGTGTYTLTGVNVGFQTHLDKQLAAGTGDFPMTGNDAQLVVGHVLLAASGTFLLTAPDTALLFTRLLAAESGTFTLDGQDAALTYTPAGPTYTLTAEPGSFSYTGNPTNLIYSGAPTQPTAEPGGGGGRWGGGISSSRRDRFARYLQEALEAPEEKYPAKPKKRIERERAAEKPPAVSPPAAKVIRGVEAKALREGVERLPLPQSFVVTTGARPPVEARPALVPIQSRSRVARLTARSGTRPEIRPFVLRTTIAPMTVWAVENPSDEELIGLHLTYLAEAH